MPFELDRVLGREHEERALELVRLPGRGDVVLLHRLEQGGLRLRRRAVDLVGEDDLRKNRPRHEPQHARAVLLVEHLGARDVRRHQIRRELDALEAKVENRRERLDQQRLRQPGHARDQAVASREQGDEHLVHHLVLPDDDLAELGEDLFASFLDAFGEVRDGGTQWVRE